MSIEEESLVLMNRVEEELDLEIFFENNNVTLL